MNGNEALKWRTAVRPADRDRVREIVVSTGFFNTAEENIAVELVDEHLARGEASGYLFIFAERDGRTEGYACYGPIDGTECSYDLFWIAVGADARGRGAGTALMAQTEAAVARRGGGRIYVETSSRQQYEPTRAFYVKCGYVLEAVLEDFYAPGDGKCVYMKAVERAPAGTDTDSSCGCDGAV